MSTSTITREQQKPHLVLLLLVVGMGATVGYAITRLVAYFTFETRVVALVSLVGVVLGLALGGFFLIRSASRQWFHPLAFPLAYIASTLLFPILYLTITGKPIGVILPSDISPTLIMIFALSVAGMALGAKIGLGLTRVGFSRDLISQHSINQGTILAFGRLLGSVSIALRLFEVLALAGRPYGLGSATYGFESWAGIAASGLVFTSIILITTANGQMGYPVLRSFDLVMSALFILMSLAVGSRGELIAPGIFVLWSHHHYVKEIRLWQGLAMLTAVVLLFTLIGVYRGPEDLTLDEAPTYLEQGLVSLSTPTFTTSRLIDQVPAQSPYAGGSTYLAALKRQLPGPISYSVFGPPEETGTFVLRDLLNFDNPNAGFGFSFPSEAYLNFGVWGSFSIAVLGGFLLGYAFRKQSPEPTRALHLLYPILVASLPLSLRSDAVLQIKGLLYPLAALFLAYSFARRRSELPRSHH